MDIETLKKTIMEAHQSRFACKVFNPDKAIPDTDLEFLLEIARISPSSIGLEPWKFVVITDPIVQARLKPECWNQNQITDASALIVILARTAHSLLDDGYVTNHYEKRGMNPDWFVNFVSGLPNPLEWTKRQAYIALGNIMSSAKMIGIDSCPIEGFYSSKKVTEILGYDTKEFDTAVMVALGYNAGEARPKMRLEKEAVVDYL